MIRRFVLFLLAVSRLHAFSPANPETKVYSAADGRFIARVEPSIKKFGDQPIGRPKLFLFRFLEEEKIYERVGAFDLENRIGPGELLLSADGSKIVALGDFYDWAYASPVIVVYGIDGKVLKKLMLDDVLPKEEVIELRKSGKRWYISASLSDTLFIQRDIQVGGPGTYKKSLVINLTTYQVSEFTP